MKATGTRTTRSEVLGAGQLWTLLCNPEKCANTEVVRSPGPPLVARHEVRRALERALCRTAVHDAKHRKKGPLEAATGHDVAAPEHAQAGPVGASEDALRKARVRTDYADPGG